MLIDCVIYPVLHISLTFFRKGLSLQFLVNCVIQLCSPLIKLSHFITVMKKLNYMAVVNRVCSQSMLAAQDEIKNSPVYVVNGEVAILCNNITHCSSNFPPRHCHYPNLFIVSCLLCYVSFPMHYQVVKSYIPVIVYLKNTNFL